MRYLLALLLLCGFAGTAPAQVAKRVSWRAATAAELEAALPDRAQVEKERIETEKRSASGLIDSRGHIIAAVVLITAGYSANGKYSHYLLLQSPLRVGDLALAAGSYVIGWTRGQEGLLVHFYVAETGIDEGVVVARSPEKPVPVVSLRIWPPAEKSIIQIGRFIMPYALTDR